MDVAATAVRPCWCAVHCASALAVPQLPLLHVRVSVCCWCNDSSQLVCVSREMLFSIGQVLLDTLLNEVEWSAAHGGYGLLMDESCDITVTKQLLTFLRYVDVAGAVKVRFGEMRALGDGSFAAYARRGCCGHSDIMMRLGAQALPTRSSAHWRCSSRARS